MLDQLAAGNAGPNFFLKAGRTRIRLVAEPGHDEGSMPVFFTQVSATFRGKTRPKFLLSAVVIGAEGRDLPEDKVNKVIPVVVPKQVLTDILNTLVEGWDLFDLESGHGLSINKTGSGLNTEYTVNVSPKPVPLADIIPMDMTLIEAAEKFMELSAQREASQGDSPDGADAPEEDEAPKGKAGKKQGGGW